MVRSRVMFRRMEFAFDLSIMMSQCRTETLSYCRLKDSQRQRKQESFTNLRAISVELDAFHPVSDVPSQMMLTFSNLQHSSSWFCSTQSEFVLISTELGTGSVWLLGWRVKCVSILPAVLVLWNRFQSFYIYLGVAFRSFYEDALLEECLMSQIRHDTMVWF